ncbi:cis-prenyltransferase, partial [Tulasnella sp. 418]
MGASDIWRWLQALIISWFTRLVIAVLSAGPVPTHIAIIMDGNRRYARSHQKLVQEGHAEGFNALHRTLEVCLKLQIKCVSVYAFSIENFKRSPAEVEALMQLAKNKLMEFCRQDELLQRYGVRLNIIGRKEMLPEDVQEVASQVEYLTRHNTNAILNICMPYTSRDEMTSAIQTSLQKSLPNTKGKGKRPDSMEFREITEHDIDANLLTNLKGSPPLDILIRTSGTNRFSDFMLWQ